MAKALNWRVLQKTLSPYTVEGNPYGKTQN